MQIVRQFILHSIVLSVLLFIAFCKMENADMGVVILGFILYLPVFCAFSDIFSRTNLVQPHSGLQGPGGIYPGLAPGVMNSLSPSGFASYCTVEKRRGYFHAANYQNCNTLRACFSCIPPRSPRPLRFIFLRALRALYRICIPLRPPRPLRFLYSSAVYLHPFLVINHKLYQLF